MHHVINWHGQISINFKLKINIKITDMEEEIIGTTGEIVDLFNDELTKEEWNALAVVHKMKNRLNLGIRFDWSKSIDVRSDATSQIVDESVFITDSYSKSTINSNK